MPVTFQFVIMDLMVFCGMFNVWDVFYNPTLIYTFLYSYTLNGGIPDFPNVPDFLMFIMANIKLNDILCTELQYDLGMIKTKA